MRFGKDRFKTLHMGRSYEMHQEQTGRMRPESKNEEENRGPRMQTAFKNPKQNKRTNSLLAYKQDCKIQRDNYS